MLQLVIQVTVKRSDLSCSKSYVKIKFLKTFHRKELSQKETYDIDL